MTPERWQQVKSLFHEALKLTPDERSSFLDRACSTDHSLRQEVESLLSSDQEARSAFLPSDLTLMTLTEGTRLGDYEVHSLLGSGGMGVVYRARDERLGREVAIKVLPPFFASDRERRRRFEQEARAAAALNHPNILAVYQLGTYEGSPYLVSELLEGETLRSRVKRGAIPLPEALEYVRQIARGLSAAHEKGIVHRDLKPENLFVTEDGQIKILDFGLAKQTRLQPSEETKPASLATETGMVMGTIGYMSPEQVRGQAADFRADIFAFGAILYEMLTGKRAFTGESSADVASAILKDDPPQLSNSVAGMPQALEGIIRHCLEKNPGQRFQSVAELTTALCEIEVPSAGRVSAPRVGPGFRWRSRLVTSAMIFVTLVAAVVASILYFRSRQTSIDSIAVMPFVNKNGNAGNDLGDGLTSGLIDSLSQIPNLRVISRSSISHYKGKEVDPQKVGRELNVRAVLTATLTPRGDGFIVDAELVNTGDDSHIWGQQYNRKASDSLTLQAQLASAVSSKLRPRLAIDAKTKLAHQGTSNPEAYALYVRGSYAEDRWEAKDSKKALAYFQQAVEKDPAYPQAYAGMSETYAFLGHYGSMPIREAVEKARAAAHRALELDADLAEGHCALGVAAYLDWQWQEAEQETRRCIELNPNLSIGHQYLAWVLWSLAKVDQALAEQKRAVELDPVSFTSNFFLADEYYFLRDYDRAIEEMLKMVEAEPGVSYLHDSLANSYFMKGEYDKAAFQYEEEFRVQGKTHEAEALHRGYAKGGSRGLLLALIELWKDPSKREDYAPYDVAVNYVMLGDRENAFLWLDRAYLERNGMLPIQIEPQLDNIRSDPRYRALLNRMGFPP